MKKEFNLSLSGGAALGYAHIGVLEYLYELNLSPKAIYGVSMGAIVGSVEALDISNSEKLIIFNKAFNTLKWIKPSFNGSLISTKKIEKMLKDIFGNLKFSHLQKDLHIGATNYHNGNLTIFNKKNDILIVDAILASMAVPAIFPPRYIQNIAYVDGYLSSNIIVNRDDKDIYNLVVNVTGKNSFKNLSTNEIKKLNILNHLERSIRELIYNQTKNTLKNVNNLILIEPDISSYKTFSFNKYKEIKEIGKIAAKNCTQINKLLI